MAKAKYRLAVGSKQEFSYEGPDTEFEHNSVLKRAQHLANRELEVVTVYCKRNKIEDTFIVEPTLKSHESGHAIKTPEGEIKYIDECTNAGVYAGYEDGSFILLYEYGSIESK